MNLLARSLAPDSEQQSQGERLLRASDHYFVSAFEYAAIGMALVAPDGRWLEVNRALCQMLGYSNAELMQTTFQDITHPDDLEADLEYVRQMLAGEINTYQMEKRYIHKQGQIVWIWLSVSLLSDAEGRPVHFISQVQDVTQRKRAEERIGEQAALLDKAQDAIVVCGTELDVHFWNQGAERLYGWTAAEVLGCNVCEVLYRDPRLFERARRFVIDDGEWRGELLHRTQDGREVRVESRWSLVRDVSGHPKSFLSINTDITERKKLEALFLRAQRMESIGTLAAGIAHDLNNVLAPIMMSIDLLRLRTTDRVSRDTLALISSSAKRGAEMVSQMLCFGRGMEGERVAIDTASLLRELASFVNETFPKNIDFKVAPGPAPWSINGDATQLYQVMLNLCVNARDAMPEGGPITISVANASIDEEVAVGLGVKTRRFVLFQIEDAGSGIPQTIIDKIFDPFFTTKEVGKGTGLGLSTSLGIVKSHGGFLRVDSEPGRGTCFKVYLPAEAEEGRDATAVTQDELPCGGGEVILVVDDESSIRKITRQTLEAFGYRVLTADNGSDALAVFELNRADIAVVLTDMVMPVMDGPALIQILRHIAPEVPIIAASGIGASSYEARAAGAGVEYFVPKPYTAEKLLGMLAAVLRRSKGEG